MAQNVVQILEKKLGSIIKLADKWLNQWGIPLQDILNLFHHLKKDELKGLIEGSYEIVNKLILKGNVIILAAANGPVSFLFSENKTGKDKQHHWDKFNDLISEVPHIELPEMKVQPFTIRKKMSDFEIRNELGGNDKLCFKSKAESLRVLGSTTTDAYRDGKANIVYYLDEEGELSYSYCGWDAGGAKWYCGAYRADVSYWDVGDRVLTPATYYL
jgi:hypothetical protein